MVQQLIFLELNEVNFDFIRAYIARGYLPRLAQLIETHGVEHTTSEHQYEHLEPWIQWVTAHTGLTFAEHGVFRLGDIVSRDIPQIWEVLEDQGFTVGAISPMNAKHRLRNPAFFVPDPWTKTGISGGGALQRLFDALSQAINDNAESKITPSSLFNLAIGAVIYAQPANYANYLTLALTSRRAPWRKAIILDLLLSDIFAREVRRAKSQFSSLFLNAAAHIQHHYMFSAMPYDGPHRNPDWYIARGADPVLEVYRLYDEIVGQLQKAFPVARLMIATGLHQVPHEHATFYWRLRDHAAFLHRVGIEFEEVEPRMSRDFLVKCSDEVKARLAEVRLNQAAHEDGTPLFEVDNRGTELFVMFTFPKEIQPNDQFTIAESNCGGLFEQVSFVALKNGEHNGIGYFLDTGVVAKEREAGFPLTDIPRRIMTAMGVDLLEEA